MNHCKRVDYLIRYELDKLSFRTRNNNLPPYLI